MGDCRICQSAAPEKYLNQLKTNKKYGSKGYSEILLFCLNIQISDESGTKEKVCTKCFTKTLSFYKFKLMALKNDAYLKSVNPSKPKLSQNSDDSIKEIKNEVSDESEIDELEHNNSEPTIVPPLQSDAISDDDISVTLENDHEMKCQIPLESEIDKIKCEVLIDDENGRDSDEDWVLPEDEDALDDLDDNSENEHIPDNSDKRSITTENEKKILTKTTHKNKLNLRNQGATILAKPGVCNLCGANVRNLKEHLLVHLPKSQRKRFPCKLCTKSFLTPSAKKRHHNLAHLKKLRHCDACNKDYRDLQYHNRTVHNPQQMQYECGECSTRFLYSSQLDIHMRQHTKEKPFQCGTCGKKFRLKSVLDNHVRSVHNQEKNFPCKICTKSFFKKCHLERHMRIHTKVSDGSKIDEFEHNNSEPTIVPPLQSDAISDDDISVTLENDHEMKCQIPLESEIDKIKFEVLIDDENGRDSDEDWVLPEDEDALDDLDDNSENEHIPDNSDKRSITTENEKKILTKTTHKNQLNLRNQGATILAKPGICNLCGAHVRNLKEHLLVHIPKSERKRFPCKLCTKSFLTPSAKKRHHNLAHLKKLRHCDTCNKDYRDLHYHNLTVHNPEQMYECGECSARFPYSSQLDIHMRQHTKEKPFQCETCGKKFRLKSVLDNHVRSVHNQEKNFSCKICTKSFFKKFHFDRHIRSHTKEKPYVCKACGQSYAMTESLRVHQLAAHNNNARNYSCNLCNKAFKTASTLNAHKKTHTNEKPFTCPHCPERYGRLFDMQRHINKNHKHIQPQTTGTPQDKMDIDSP